MKDKALQLLKHPLFSGSAIMIVGTNAVAGFNYIYHFAMGRLLGVEAYGELAALFSIIGLLGMIPMALSLVITKYVSSIHDESTLPGLIRFLQKKVLILGLIVVAICLLFSEIARDFLKLTSTVNFLLVAIILALSFSVGINRAVMQGLLKFKEYVLSLMFDNFFKLVGGVSFVLLGWSVFGALLALVIGGFFSILVGFYLIKDYLKGKGGSIPNLKPYIAYSLPVFIHQLVILSFISSDLILVKVFFDPIQAGYYSATSTVGKIIFFAASPVMSVMFPIISKRISSGISYYKIFWYSFALTLFITVSGALVFSLFAPTAISLLFGKGFGASSFNLPLFSIFMILLSLNNLLIGFFLSINQTKIMIMPLIAAVAQIVFIFFFHETLIQVMSTSIAISALLTGGLIVYLVYGRQASAYISNSSGVQTGKNHRKRSDKN